MKYLLDTNILIAISIGDTDAINFITAQHHAEFFVSVITITEALWYKNITKIEEEIIEDFISTCVVIPVDEALARAAILFRRDHKLKTADSLLAATAISIKAKLLTRDTALVSNCKEFAIGI